MIQCWYKTTNHVTNLHFMMPNHTGTNSHSMGTLLIWTDQLVQVREAMPGVHFEDRTEDLSDET